MASTIVLASACVDSVATFTLSIKPRRVRSRNVPLQETNANADAGTRTILERIRFFIFRLHS
jgi:hypothetical protein